MTRETTTSLTDPEAEARNQSLAIDTSALKNALQERRKKKSFEGRGPYKKWSDDDIEKFITGIQKFGRKWDKVAEHMGNKDKNACGSYAFSFRKKLEKNPDHPGIVILPVL